MSHPFDSSGSPGYGHGAAANPGGGFFPGGAAAAAQHQAAAAGMIYQQQHQQQQQQTFARQQQILGHPQQHQPQHQPHQPPHSGYYHPPAAHTQQPAPPPLIRSPGYFQPGVKAERASPNSQQQFHYPQQQHPATPPALASIPRGVEVARTSQALPQRSAPGMLPASSAPMHQQQRPYQPQMQPQPQRPQAVRPQETWRPGVSIQRPGIPPNLPPGLQVHRGPAQAPPLRPNPVMPRAPGLQRAPAPAQMRTSLPSGISISRQASPVATPAFAPNTSPAYPQQQQQATQQQPVQDDQAVRSYRPLVKDFRNDEDGGFDLSRVKMEPGAANPAETASFRSYMQRRIEEEEQATPSPPPPPAPAPQPVQQQSEPVQPQSEVSSGENGTSASHVDTNAPAGEAEPPSESQEQQVENSESAEEPSKNTQGEQEETEKEGDVDAEEKSPENADESEKADKNAENEEGEANNKDTEKETVDEITTKEDLDYADEEYEGAEELEEVLEGEEDYEEYEEDLEGMEDEQQSGETKEDEEDQGGVEYDEDGAPKQEGNNLPPKRPSTSSVEDSGGESSNQSGSPFKKPSIDSGFHTSGGDPSSSKVRNRHKSFSSGMSDCSDTSKSMALDQQKEVYQQQLNYYRKPLVGKETVCVFCFLQCSEKDPKLLNCLHSACSECFKEAVQSAKAQSKNVSSVTIDDDDMCVEDEGASIQCPLCRMATTEKEAIDNLFLLTETGDGYDDQESQICNCDEKNPTTSWCGDCEEHLCDECVKAHKRVKITRDHAITPIVSKPKSSSSKKSSKDESKSITCSTHKGESFNRFCEKCEVLACKLCANSSHQNHPLVPLEDAVPMLKSTWNQGLTDLRLKKNLLDENKDMLTNKLQEISIKERSLMRQIDEVKSLLTRRIDARFRALTNDVSKTVRQKRKAVEGRKSILDRFLVQADYALAFFDHNLMFCNDGKAFLGAKRMADRQLRYLGKADASTGINPNSRDFAMDLYFQRYTGRNMHGSLDSVVAQTLSDIKFLSEPPPPPPPPVATAPVANSVQSGPQAATVDAPTGMPQRQRPPMSALPRSAPITPVKRGGPPSMRGSPSPRGSPMRGGSIRGSSRGSPARGAVTSRGRGSVMASARGRISVTAVRGRAMARGTVRGRGIAQPARGAARGRGAAPGGRGAAARGAASSRGGGVVRARGTSTITPAARGRGAAAATMAARGRGGVKATISPVPAAAGRGTQIQQKSSSLASVQRNPGITITPSGQAGPRPQQQQQQQQQQQKPANQNPYFLAAYGNAEQKAAAQQPQQQQQQQQQRVPQSVDDMRKQQEAAARQRQVEEYQRRKALEMQQQQQQQRVMMQQRQQQQQQMAHIPPGVTIQSGVTIQPQSASQNFPTSSQNQPGPQQTTPTSSWHSPQLGSAIKITPAGQPPSASSTPTKTTGDSSFKITLPRMRTGPPSQEQGTADKDHNVSGESVDSDGAPKVTPKPSEKEKPKKNRPLDLTALLDDHETTGSPAEWLEEGIQERRKEAEANGVKNGSSASVEEDPLNVEQLKDFDKVEGEGESKIEIKDEPFNIVKKPSIIKAEMRNKSKEGRKSNEAIGNANKDGGNDTGEPASEEEWCAVCHDGGDTLYCCDRCPKVYHLYCYIPPLSEEPPDDWICLMCATKDEVSQFPNSLPNGKGKLGDRDLKVCRRVLFELYNQYPESMPFRNCSDLNFPEYLKIVKVPIALDVITERLDVNHPAQYASVEEFLCDVRKMFKNCYKVNKSGSEFYGHAKALEEILDKHLEVWLPHLAYDQAPTKSFNITATKAKRPASPVAGPSKKRKPNDGPPKTRKKVKEKRKKKEESSASGGRPKRRKDASGSGDDDGESDSTLESDMSEGEKLEYLEALERSLEETTPPKSKKSASDEYDFDAEDDDEDFKTNTKSKGGKPKRSTNNKK